MNVNADQAATALAATLGADLILLSDVSGILDGKGQRIAEMTAAKAEQLIDQGIITDGMIVKVNAALDAARTLGRPVDIASWRHAEQLPALFNGTPIGSGSAVQTVQRLFALRLPPGRTGYCRLCGLVQSAGDRWRADRRRTAAAGRGAEQSAGRGASGSAANPPERC
ncbi:hypothetical protein Phum_PHUM621980 [Pediculus humanus corporis]|uniref:Aspartate/glutamate/uridylate kinase domain-containing protein n=1 Tax=Pediculus humanus subsp. corporis TaxID=121224 RepID=E0W4J4_PEDHC|nr:hypothetical protein Phum_PHUM621980 [Pediculus humanus corporis]